MLHQGTKGSTGKPPAIQQHSNYFTVGSMLFLSHCYSYGGKGVVGALAYLESSVANAHKLLGDTPFVLQGLSSNPPWGAPGLS